MENEKNTNGKKNAGRPIVGAQKRERFNTTIDTNTKKMMDAIRLHYGMSIGEYLDTQIEKEYKKLVKSKKIEEIQFEVPGQLTVEDFIAQEEKAAAEAEEVK